MPYKDVEARKKAVRESMRKLRGVVGYVNPCDDVNPAGEECEPQNVNPCCEPLKVFPSYNIHPKHKEGCRCMLCDPGCWPDLKVKFYLSGLVAHGPEKKWYPNYDIHPAHADNCVCLCCLGGVMGRDGKFKLMKELLNGL